MLIGDIIASKYSTIFCTDVTDEGILQRKVVWIGSQRIEQTCRIVW